MAPKLINFCLVWTLVLGCWGGVLAAAICPHVGCETVAAAPGHSAAHGQHAPAESRRAEAALEQHSGHAGTDEAHCAGAYDSAESRPELPASARGFMKTPRDASSCSHCIGRADAPPAPSCERQTNPIRKAGKDAAAHHAGQVTAPSRPFVREITPAQHAPPVGPDRHLFLGVFRI